VVESDGEAMQVDENDEEVAGDILPRETEEWQRDCSDNSSNNAANHELEETPEKKKDVCVDASHVPLGTEKKPSASLQEYVAEIVENETVIISATTANSTDSAQEYRIPLNALNDSVKQLIQDSGNIKLYG
jgi:hypothetical protein